MTHPSSPTAKEGTPMKWDTLSACSTLAAPTQAQYELDLLELGPRVANHLWNTSNSTHTITEDAA